MVTLLILDTWLGKQTLVFAADFVLQHKEMLKWKL